jgi:hypothetical protein
MTDIATFLKANGLLPSSSEETAHLNDLMSTTRVFISVMAGRGGPGKTTGAELVTTTFNIPAHLAFTTDTTNATLRKIGLTSNEIINLIEGRTETAMLRMMEPLVKVAAGVVCVDHGAREEQMVDPIWAQLIAVARSQSINFIVVRPVTADSTTMETALNCAKKVTAAGGGVVVFLNRHFDWRPDDDERWRKDPRRNELLGKAYKEVDIYSIPAAAAVDGRRLGRSLREIVSMTFNARVSADLEKQKLEDANVEQAKELFGFAAAADVSMYLSDHMPRIARAFNHVLSGMMR